jgi:hypothetical protein
MGEILLSIKQQIINHPYMAVFFALLSALLRFLIESLAVDGIAYILLIFMVAIDTYTGMKVAKLKGVFDYKVLKEKTVKKWQGHLIILCGTWVFIMMLFILNFIAGEKGISYHLLNIPMLTTILFYAGVEFLSIKDNVKQVYGIIAPSSLVGKVEGFVNAGGKDYDNILNKN